jgi:flavin-dependent dehydrogenase
LPYEELDLPIITKLGISSEQGFMLDHDLKPGGFGISRYHLDHSLCRIALDKGVEIMQGCRVSDVKLAGDGRYHIQTSAGAFRSALMCGSYGKYTPQFMNLDDSQYQRGIAGINYIGVKYHIRASLAEDRIELHNFRDGYCGVSKVDHGLHCLCYLTTSGNLQENGKDIKLMEKNILYKNPFLRDIFTRSQFVDEQPLVISNVHFNKKQTDANGIFLLGDAAGAITPLCGNGMSMALRASKLLASELITLLQGRQKTEDALRNYRKSWNTAFHKRITAGYYLQYLFGKKRMTHISLKILSHMPKLTDRLVSMTHGEAF